MAMYKNFKLTNEERAQILEQHSSYGYRQPLNEQPTGENKVVSCSSLGIKTIGYCDVQLKKPVKPCAELGVKTIGYCYVDTKKPVSGIKKEPINEQDLVRLVNRVINEQTNVDESNFSQFIKTPNKLVIVDMTAEWCSPCQKMKKHFDEITADPKLNNKIVLGTYNFDFEKPLAKKYKVQGIPYVMFFRNGKLIYKFLGYKDKSYIISLIQKL